jgi:hypothetical protein
MSRYHHILIVMGGFVGGAGIGVGIYLWLT